MKYLRISLIFTLEISLRFSSIRWPMYLCLLFVRAWHSRRKWKTVSSFPVSTDSALKVRPSPLACLPISQWPFRIDNNLDIDQNQWFDQVVKAHNENFHINSTRHRLISFRWQFRIYDNLQNFCFLYSWLKISISSCFKFGPYCRTAFCVCSIKLNFIANF